MAEVEAADVAALMPGTIDPNTLVPFLTAADAFVTNRLGGESIGSGLLYEITRWVAAHLATAQYPLVAQENIAGEYSATYQVAAAGGIGLASTFYGQTALSLDPTGLLSESGKKRASLKVY